MDIGAACRRHSNDWKRECKRDRSSHTLSGPWPTSPSSNGRGGLSQNEARSATQFLCCLLVSVLCEVRSHELVQHPRRYRGRQRNFLNLRSGLGPRFLSPMEDEKGVGERSGERSGTSKPATPASDAGGQRKGAMQFATQVSTGLPLSVFLLLPMRARPRQPRRTAMTVAISNTKAVRPKFASISSPGVRRPTHGYNGSGELSSGDRPTP